MPSTNQLDPRLLRGHNGPGWRSLLAQELAVKTKRGDLNRLDPLVRDTIAYLRRFDRRPDGPQLARQQFPMIAMAYQLNHDSAMNAKLKILGIAGCDSRQIASWLKLDPTAIRHWQELFFDLADWHDAHSWVLVHVILPEEKAGHAQLAAQLRLAAAGGSAAAMAILRAEDRVPLERGAKLFDLKLGVLAKFDAALSETLRSPKDRRRFVRLAAELKLQEQRIRLQERRLAERCNQLTRQAELAQARQEAANHRARRQAEEMALKRESLQLRREGSRAMRELEFARLWRERLAEEEAAMARAAASPLAQLRWSAQVVCGNDERVEAVEETNEARPTIDHEVCASPNRIRRASETSICGVTC